MLYEELGIASVDELEEAIHEGRLRGPARASAPRPPENLLHGIELMRAAGGRVQIDVAMDARRGDRRRAVRGARLPALHVRRLAAPDAGDRSATSTSSPPRTDSPPR